MHVSLDSAIGVHVLCACVRTYARMCMGGSWALSCLSFKRVQSLHWVMSKDAVRGVGEDGMATASNAPSCSFI